MISAILISEDELIDALYELVLKIKIKGEK